MRRFLLLVLTLASLALPGSALARGGDYIFDGGTQAQRSQVRAALGASTFDWNAVPTRVLIHIRPDVPTRATPGHIWLDARLVSSGRFAWAAIQDEYAHQVDFSRFDAATREHLTGQLGARDWCYGVTGLQHADYGCERFASTLVWAFWPSKDNAYRPTSSSDESAALPPQQFRTLITGLLGMGNPFSVRR